MRTQEHLNSEIFLLKSLSVTVCKQDFSEQQQKNTWKDIKLKRK